MKKPVFNEKTKANYIVSNTGGNCFPKNQLKVLIIPLISYFQKKKEIFVFL